MLSIVGCTSVLVIWTKSRAWSFLVRLTSLSVFFFWLGSNAPRAPQLRFVGHPSNLRLCWCYVAASFVGAVTTWSTKSRRAPVARLCRRCKPSVFYSMLILRCTPPHSPVLPTLCLFQGSRWCHAVNDARNSRSNRRRPFDANEGGADV